MVAGSNELIFMNTEEADIVLRVQTQTRCIHDAVLLPNNLVGVVGEGGK